MPSLTRLIILFSLIVFNQVSLQSISEDIETEPPITYPSTKAVNVTTTESTPNATVFELLFGKKKTDKVEGLRLCVGDTWFQAVVKPFPKSLTSTRLLKTTSEPSAEICAQICYSVIDCSHAIFMPSSKSKTGDCSLFKDVEKSKCADEFLLVKKVIVSSDEIKLTCLQCREVIKEANSSKSASPSDDTNEVTRSCGSTLYFHPSQFKGNLSKSDKIRTVAINSPSQCASFCYGIPTCKQAIYRPSKNPNTPNLAKCHMYTAEFTDKTCTKGSKLSSTANATDRLLLSCFSCHGKFV